MDEHHENFNKKLENIEKNQSQLNNAINEIKNTLRKAIVEKQISDLENRAAEITQSQQQKGEKKTLKMKIV